MTNVYFRHVDLDNDQISDHIAVYSDNFTGDSLFGDYRGVELALIHYIPSRADSISRAEEIAQHIIKGEVKNGATWDKKNTQEPFNAYAAIPFLPRWVEQE